MDEHLLMCYSDQHNLHNAFDRRDIEAFRRALHSAADVEKYESEASLSLFERACQTPRSHAFIKECIAIGCDVNKENPSHRKRPINFAVESHCYDNLSALLSDPNVDIDAKYATQTPINSLAESITDANFPEIFRCIKLLVIHCADLNIPNRREMTPILQIIKNRHLNEANKDGIVFFLLGNGCDIDLDTYRNGEARTILTKRYPHEQLPAVRSANDRRWDFNALLSALRNESEGEFLHGLNALAESCEGGRDERLRELFTAVDNDETLLIAAIKRDLTDAVERMLRLGADINFAVEQQSPIEYSCIFGHWRVLEILLRSPKIQVNHVKTPLVSIVITKIGERITNKCNYEKCFQQLINRTDIDINKTDIYKHSPLHYAVKYNNRDGISALLKRGAYIGAKNHFNKLAISNISPKVLEKHFDACITTNDVRRGEDNFEIQLDYTNLVPLHTRNQHKSLEHGTNQRSPEKCADEMLPIEYLAESNDLKHLIKHPLIASFLFLKWNRLAFVFYVNFLLCFLYAASTVTYVLSCYNEHADSGALKHSLQLTSLVLTIYIAARETFQFICSPYVYLKSLENYMELALIILTLLILKGDDFSENVRRTIAATTILLLAVELYLLAGSLPFWSFSTHYVMLKTVSISFLKSFLLYSILLIAFSLAFFTLLRTEPSSSTDDDGNFNKFEDIGRSIMKTLVMSTGEFDAASINFTLNTWSYIIFVIFLFLISTVLFNLLNGLAVSDTQAIKSDALLTNYIRRVQVMARYERILLGKEHSFLPITCMNYLARSRISVFKALVSAYKIRIRPNENNQIKAAQLSPKNTIDSVDYKIDTETDQLKALECLRCCSCFGDCFRMDRKIVKSSLHVLDKVRSEQEEEEDKEQLKTQIRNIEQSLSEIMEKLNTLSQ